MELENLSADEKLILRTPVEVDEVFDVLDDVLAEDVGLVRMNAVLSGVVCLANRFL